MKMTMDGQRMPMRSSAKVSRSGCGAIEEEEEDSSIRRTPDRPMVIREGSPQRRRQMVVFSLSDNDVPVPPGLSPPVVEEMAMMAVGDADVGGNTGGGTTVAESVSIHDERAAATPSTPA